MTNVTVLNVLTVQPQDLNNWISSQILNIRLPEYGPNSTINVQTDILPLLPLISNRIAVITELYSQCTGNKPQWTAAKKDAVSDLDKRTAETTLSVLTAYIDIFYRTIQALEALRETAGRLLTNAYNSMRMSNS